MFKRYYSVKEGKDDNGNTVYYPGFRTLGSLYIWNYFVYTKYFGVTGSSIFKFGGFFNLGSAYGFKSREEAENFIKSCEISDKVAE